MEEKIVKTTVAAQIAARLAKFYLEHGENEEAVITKTSDMSYKIVENLYNKF